MPEAGNDAGANDVSRQIRAPYRGGTRRSYYGDAFQTEGESAYQRLQRDAAHDEPTSSVYRSTQMRSAYRDSTVSHGANRTSGSSSQRRTSLRRETVSSLGYEPGQSGRPSSFVNEAPIDNEYSSLGTAGAANHGSWRSNSQKKMPTMKSSRPSAGVFVGAAIAIVIVVVVALVAMSVGR